MTRQVVCNGLRKVKVSSSALQLSSTWHLALSSTGQVARNVFCLVVNDRPEHMTSQQAIINQNCGVAVQKLSSGSCPLRTRIAPPSALLISPAIMRGFLFNAHFCPSDVIMMQ